MVPRRADDERNVTVVSPPQMAIRGACAPDGSELFARRSSNQRAIASPADAASPMSGASTTYTAAAPNERAFSAAASSAPRLLAITRAVPCAKAG